MKILITGGAGFIGHYLVSTVLTKTDWDVVVFDKFTYASAGLRRLEEIGAYPNPRVAVHMVDTSQPISPLLVAEVGHVDYIVHMAAGTHVDNSVRSPRDFILSNIMGTFEMLEYARGLKGLKKFLYFSTDEVFGSAPNGTVFGPNDRYNSGNPYAATKAGGEELAMSYANTFNVPVVVSHCSNVVGIRQHPEKFLPKIVKAAIDGTVISIHVNAKGEAGARHYIAAHDVTSAVLVLLDKGAIREKYNITGPTELTNIGLVDAVETITMTEIKRDLIVPENIRPGNDARYHLDATKLEALGWRVRHSLQGDLSNIVDWMTEPENVHWLDLSR